MSDKELDDILEAWVDQEIESAPTMQPTAGMYHSVRAKQKKIPLFSLRSRWAFMGAAVASLLLILYVVRFHTSIFQVLQPDPMAAWVGQRDGFDSGRGIVIEPVKPPGKGPGKGETSFGQLVFHLDKPSARSVQGVDMQVPQTEAVTLTPADNYRLFLAPARDWYVYVFQMSSSGSLDKLFPNETFSAVQNPLERGQTYYLPSEPYWFYLEDSADLTAGEGRLYVAASVQPLTELAESYTRYSQAEDESDRQVMLAGLLKRLDTVEATGSDETAVWVLVLNHPQ